MALIWTLFLYTMVIVMSRGHGGDRVEDPPYPGGRDPGQHEQDGKSYYEFLLSIIIQLL